MFKILESTLAEMYMSLIGDQELFVNKTVQETIWGYEDPLFRMLMLLGLIESPVMKAMVCAEQCCYTNDMTFSSRQTSVIHHYCILFKLVCCYLQ